MVNGSLKDFFAIASGKGDSQAGANPAAGRFILSWLLSPRGGAGGAYEGTLPLPDTPRRKAAPQMCLTKENIIRKPFLPTITQQRLGSPACGGHSL